MLQNHLFERPPVASFAQYVRKHLGQLQMAFPGLQLHVDFGTVSTFLRPLLIRATVSLAMCCIWRPGETDPTRSIRSGPFPPINNGKAGPALTWGQTDLCRGMGRTVLHPGCSRLAGDASVCHSPKEKTSQQRISHSLAALPM